MLSFFPRGVLDEILNLIESVSDGFPSYSPPPGNFIAGRPKAALLLWFLVIVLLSVCGLLALGPPI